MHTGREYSREEAGHMYSDKKIYLLALPQEIAVQMIFSMESGFILPNIHYYTPLKGVEGLEKGRLLVVTEKIPLSDQHELFATSNYGFGGTNAIALLRRNNKRKSTQKIRNSMLPQLICVSGRNKEGVNKILDDFSKQEYDAEYAYLLQQAFSIPHENHIYRGFALYNKFNEITRSCKRLEFGDRKLVMLFDNFNEKWYSITKGVDVIVKGKVYEQNEEYLIIELPRTKGDNKLCMEKDDIYTELRLRGYQYNNEFKGISRCNVDISQATIEWKNNWICCIDNILQMFLLHLNTKELHVARGIQQLILNIPKFLKQIETSNNSIAVELHEDTRIIRAPGVEIRGYHTKTIEKTNPEAAVLEVVKFIPNETQLDTESSVRSLVQLILENVNGINIDIVEIYEDGEEEQLLHALMTKAIDEQPLIQHQVTVLINNIKKSLISLVQGKIKETKSNCLIVVATKLLEAQEKLRELQESNFKNIFLISRESLKCNLSEIKNISLNILCSYTTNNESLILLRLKTNTFMKERTLSLCNALHNFQWISRLRIMLHENNRVLLYTDNIEPSGILGLVCSLKKEYSTEKICCIFVMDDAPEFDPDSNFYRQQLDKKLSVNVWKNKQWGTYRHLLLPETKLVQRTNYCLNSIPFEAISSLQWIEGEPLEDEITFDGEDTITVSYYKTGCFMFHVVLGLLCRGERVMGICLEGPLRTVIRTKFFLPIPDEWTMEDAASVISAYSPIIALLLTIGCTELLKAACHLGPIDGIFNLAAVLRDGIFENQTEKTFKDALLPKTYTTQNLDIISRQLCPNLRYFVVFSSFAAGRGILGQTNYAMANSITDRICEKRKEEGYSALAIQWAAVREVGIVARLQNGRSEVIDGTIPQRICSCLQQLDKFLFQSETIVASMVVAPNNCRGENDLFEDIMNIFGITNIGSISMQSTLPEIGLDSITLVEIKQILERKYDMFLETDEIRGLTLAR
ncbi:fatty acid synthase [Holotrichia oblita]|uniref:Fatty acid synthase n=1 Tax=Holotrichia oblita TaxID=644536 RepID=A0ACB9TDG7_HOLOL|nr:fatty acid synthase [Holotrichia oblita]